MTNQELLNSLADSEATLIEAVELELKTGYDDFEATLTRKYEEGFIDGMRHAYTLLTGDYLPGKTADEIIDETRHFYQKGN